jgi:hypothetical protein
VHHNNNNGVARCGAGDTVGGHGGGEYGYGRQEAVPEQSVSTAPQRGKLKRERSAAAARLKVDLNSSATEADDLPNTEAPDGATSDERVANGHHRRQRRRTAQHRKPSSAKLSQTLRTAQASHDLSATNSPMRQPKAPT